MIMDRLQIHIPTCLAAEQAEQAEQAELETPTDVYLSQQMFYNHFAEKNLEVMVMIDGTESVTSNSLQARYSYTVDDIEFNATFHPCVSIDGTKGAVIDFNKFHELISLDPRLGYHGDIYIQSII